ncbi:MAG TPA: CHAD domain-containing protein [Dongiaceae bacterium]|jgi:inorganic triphosphatase YgiF
MIETEVKLLADHVALAQIQQSPLFARTGSARDSAARTRKLETRYYDTADRTLQRHGLSLRIRKAGETYCQTLKYSGNNGAFGRHEWENRVAGFSLELDRISAAELTGTPCEILKSVTPETLAPIFATKVTRQSIPLKLPEAEIEVAFDEGVIEAGAQRTPISEIELELKGGDGSTLYDLATRVLEAAPVSLGTASKAQRGYALAFGTPPATLKARPSRLGKGDSVDDAIALMLDDCLVQVLANYAAAQDPRLTEGVHQMRVGLRRLRAMLGLLAKEIPAASFRTFDIEAEALADALGPARSHDALRESIEAETTATKTATAETMTAETDRQALCETIGLSRNKVHAKLRKALKSPVHARILLSLAGWVTRRGWRNELPAAGLEFLSEPAEELAARALDRLERKACKRGAHFSRLSPRGRHRLRIALKKLRYAATFFAPLYGLEDDDAAGEQGKSAKRYLSRIARLLDRLGEDHDAATSPALLDAMGRRAHSMAAQRAIDATLARQARGHPKLMKQMRRRRRDWKAAPVFW